MVGVPRSNACVACRARRKGCDGERPSCGQCTKRGVQCPGYKREMKMIMVLPGSKKSADSGISGTPSADEATPSESSMVLSSSSASSPAPQILPRSYFQTAFRSQTFGSFFDAYLPHSSAGAWPNLNTDLSVIPSTGWLQLAATVPMTDSLLENALASLALAHFERLETGPDAFQSSLLYSRAMRELSRRLRNEHECLSDATLAGVMALTIYEIQASTVTRAHSFLSHAQGALSIVRVRGWRNFTTPFGQRLFLGALMNELINSIGRRQRMPPIEMWAGFNHSHPEVPSDMRLFEILQGLPVIVEQVDALNPERRNLAEVDPETLLAAISAVTLECQTFESELTEWYTRFEQDHKRQQERTSSSNPPQPLYWLEPSTLFAELPETSPLRIFPHFYCFANPAVAEQLLLYWTARLFIPRLLQYNGYRFHEEDIPSTYRAQYIFERVASAIPALTSTVTEMALNIAQSLEYFLHPDMGLMEVQFIGFPLNLSMAYFRNMGMRELLWYEVIRTRMRDMGSAVGEFLAEMVDRGGGLEGLRLLVS